MPLIPFAPQAGVFRNGTTYQAKGRWYDMNLMRFRQDAVVPVPGWQKRSSSAAAFSGASRAVLNWTDNSASRWIGVGTSTHLYAQDEAGANHDITPVAFAAGRDDAAQNLGFGGGAYGASAYGVPAPNTVAFLPASVWSLDSWGENLVGCCDTDGKLYEWTLNTATPAAVITNAPTGCAGLVVTEEGFLFALGAGGDGRRVQWCDQRDNTTWTPLPTNQAGDFDLLTAGTLRSGKAITGGTLLFTDVDVWLATYIGTPLVYGFQRKGVGCGPISKGAVAAKDSIAAWMGRGGTFFLFDGQSVQPLDCDVQGYVADLNVNQASKVTAVHLAGPGEVWWFFPSSTSNECDRYVAWCYRESQRLGRNIWSLGQLGRTGGTGKGVEAKPLMVAASGYLYEHETGLNYDGAVPYIETGPLEIAQGDFMGEVQMIVPDQSADGDFYATFYNRMWPNGPETTYGPVGLVSPTFLLFQATETRLRFTLARQNASAQVGSMRLSVIRGDAVDTAPFSPTFVLDSSELDGSNVLA
jgi:hypothetical protein